MKRIIPLEKLKLASRCIHAGVYKDTEYNSVVTPLYPASTYFFEGKNKTSGYDYSRTANPTRSALEDNLTSLESGAGCSAVASGMAAITTVMHIFEPGSHIIAGKDIYGGTYRLFADILPQRNFNISFIDVNDLDALSRAIRPDTAAIWIETPSNPLLNITDIAAVCQIAKRAGILTVADNTFLSPCLQRPIELGVDIVVHSTTKYLNGHSDLVSGAVISSTDELAERVAYFANALGTTCSAHDSWLLLRGLKTLAVRIRAHEENANQVARFLDAQPEVEKVYYPGLTTHPGHDLASKQQDGYGGVLSFDLQGGEEAAFCFVSGLQLHALAESLGGVESLIEHPYSMSHAAMSPQALAEAKIGQGCLRISVGIEAVEDLIADLEQGFARLRASG